MSGERRRKFVGMGQCCSHRGYHLVTKSWFLWGTGRGKSMMHGKRLALSSAPGLPEKPELVPPGYLTCFTAWSQNKIKLHTKLGLWMSVWQTKGLGLARWEERGLYLHYLSYWNYWNEGQRSVLTIKCRWSVFQKMSLRCKSWSSQLDF